jgi:hypothetical protein
MAITNRDLDRVLDRVEGSIKEDLEWYLDKDRDYRDSAWLLEAMTTLREIETIRSLRSKK